MFELRRLGQTVIASAAVVGALVLGTGAAQAGEPHLTAHDSGDHHVFVEGHGYPPGEQVSIHLCDNDDKDICRNLVGFELVRASNGGDFSVSVSFHTACAGRETLDIIAFEQNTDIQRIETPVPC